MIRKSENIKNDKLKYDKTDLSGQIIKYYIIDKTSMKQLTKKNYLYMISISIIVILWYKDFVFL